MWDLTIPGDNEHDFYAVSDDADVLVHNESCPIFRYATYTKTNALTDAMYTGRTSGFGSPRVIDAARDVGDHMNELKFGPVVLGESTAATKSFARRQLYPAYHNHRRRPIN